MNYAKMIEILEWVKAKRKDGKIGTEFGSSPYVCDNVNRFQDVSDITDVKDAIKADIRVIINGRFGVPEFLGYSSDYCDDGLDNNYYPDVIAFRDNLIEELITRYKAAK